MNKGLSSQELQLERTGSFRALIEAIPRKALLKQGMSIHPRRLAALARAHAFSREFTKSQEILQELNSLGTDLDNESKVVALLTESLLHRFEGRFEEADACATEAQKLAKKNSWYELAADAEFALARSAVETGRLFLGSDLFQKITSDTKVSEYRRGLALSNWVWVLWDLGRTDEVKELLSKIPFSFRARHELCLSMIEGNLDLALTWVRDGLPEGINVDQKMYLCQSLIYACLVLGPHQKNLIPQQKMVGILKESWMSEQLLTLTDSKSQLDQVIVKGCLKILGIGKGEFKAPEAGSSWRVQLEYDFLRCLMLAQENASDALAFYAQKINPVFVEHWWLKSPLIPRLVLPEHGQPHFSVNTRWTRALGALLGLRREKSVETSVLLLNEGKLIYQNEGKRKEVDLRRSSTSIRLLKIFGHGNKSTFTKKELHQNLTTSAYLSDIHDARLFKLLNRLEKRLKTAGIPAPWYLPGNNTVILTQSIQVQSAG